MTQQNKDLINRVYESFNLRDIDAILPAMHKDVHWPNGWEGGYVEGHEEVRNYWTRQWKEIDPYVEPLSIRETADGRLEVEVHQVAKDKQGTELFNRVVKHVYTFDKGLIKTMEIVHVN